MTIVELPLGVTATPPEKPTRCPATRKDGMPCQGTPTFTGFCVGHSDWGFTSETAREHRARRTRKNAEAKVRLAQEADVKKRGIASALRVRALAESETLIDALFAPLHNKNLPEKVRQEAALKILERAFGRPGSAPSIPEGQELTDLSVDDLVDAWSDAA